MVQVSPTCPGCGHRLQGTACIDRFCPAFVLATPWTVRQGVR